MDCDRARSWLHHRRAARGRSEEHTSELQSRLHLVCRLLLEKKHLKQLLDLLIDLVEQDIRPVEHLLRCRFPAPARTLLAIIPRRLGDHLERGEGDPKANTLA